MRTITITVSDSPSGFDVSENGKSCGGLGWDEMIGQVASMTIPSSRVGGLFEMRTPEEWQQWRDRITTRAKEETK